MGTMQAIGSAVQVGKVCRQEQSKAKQRLMIS